MLTEPQMRCPEGHGLCSLSEAAACGMHCVVCGRDLVAARDGWLEGAGSSGQEMVSEVVLPSHSTVDADGVAQFLASLPLPVALELYGAGGRRSLLVRGSQVVLQQVAVKLQALWPAASLQRLESDPLQLDDTLEAYPFCFVPERPDYFPLRTWDSFTGGDPVAAVLAAALGLQDRERLWLQVNLIQLGTPSWLGRVQQRLKLESQRGYMVPEHSEGAHQLPVTPPPLRLWANGLGFVLVLLLAAAVSLLGVSGFWPAAFGLLLPGLAVVGLLRHLPQSVDLWEGADPGLVRDKVVHHPRWIRASIRGSVWADSPQRARVLARQLDQAMAQYAVSGGNSLQLQTLPDGSGEPAGMWLSPAELAGLWHPPFLQEQLAPGLLPLSGAARRAPDPQDVTGFYPIGAYVSGSGEERPVHISTAAMQHNLFCIGKPGTGKSTLMLHLCLAALGDPEQPALIVIDPHGDLARQLAGAVPDAILDRVRLLDVGDPEYCFPFNPLNVHRPGWDVTSVTNSIVDIGRSLWAEYWGPRMQIPLKRGVQLLAAANEGRPADASLGLAHLATLLNADPETRQAFLATELEDSLHREPLSRYFHSEFDGLSRYFREQIVQPVLSKAYRFEEEPMLTLFSCPDSRLDLQQVFRERQVLVVNTGKNRYGSEISDFVGSLLINVALMELVRQGEARPEDRIPVALVVDEFQTFCGVDWAALLQQMRKYGGRLVLGTQSLSSLRQQDAAIPEIILSGVYSLFAFAMNGEDAQYLARCELSQAHGGPDADTLISLEPFRAYVRLEREDGRMAHPFYFHSRPPPEADEPRAALVRRLRARYSLPMEEAADRARQMLASVQRYGHLLGPSGPQDSRPDPALAGAAGVLLAAAGSGGREPEAGLPVPPPWTQESGQPAADSRTLLSPSEWTSFLDAWEGSQPDGGGGKDDDQRG